MLGIHLKGRSEHESVPVNHVGIKRVVLLDGKGLGKIKKKVVMHN